MANAVNKMIRFMFTSGFVQVKGLVPHRFSALPSKVTDRANLSQLLLAVKQICLGEVSMNLRDRRPVSVGDNLIQWIMMRSMI